MKMGKTNLVNLIVISLDMDLGLTISKILLKVIILLTEAQDLPNEETQENLSKVLL